MRFRDGLPQLEGPFFLTDGGIETTLIFHQGLDLPEFAAFDLLKDEEGTEALRRYYEPYAALAVERGLGFVLESPTWRANPDWAARIGYGDAELDAMNRKAIAFFARDNYPSDFPDADTIILLVLAGFRVQEVPVVMQARLSGASMHSNLKAFYYVSKMLLAIFMVLVRRKMLRARR